MKDFIPKVKSKFFHKNEIREFNYLLIKFPKKFLLPIFPHLFSLFFSAVARNSPNSSRKGNFPPPGHFM